MQGKFLLAQIASLPEAVRNAQCYSNEYLSSLQKLVIRNSLNVAKISMMTMGGK